MQIRMISSNIRFENAFDGIHSWDKREPLLQKVFNDFAPDILATQEGRENQIKALARGLSIDLVDQHREWIPERMYPSLYINRQRLNLQDSGDIWLSETPQIKGSVSFKSAFPRLCTWMRIKCVLNNQEYLVANTHLDHVLEETRFHQAHVMIKELRALNKNNLPLILMGDFNESPGGEVRRVILEELDLKDPWLECQFAEESSHHSFKGEAAEGGQRIDWILIPKSFDVAEIRLDKRHFNNIYPSDHYPLLATLIPR